MLCGLVPPTFPLMAFDPFRWLVGGVEGFDESWRRNSDRADWFSISCNMVNVIGLRFLEVVSPEESE